MSDVLTYKDGQILLCILRNALSRGALPPEIQECLNDLRVMARHSRFPRTMSLELDRVEALIEADCLEDAALELNVCHNLPLDPALPCEINDFLKWNLSDYLLLTMEDRTEFMVAFSQDLLNVKIS